MNIDCMNECRATVFVISVSVTSVSGLLVYLCMLLPIKIKITKINVDKMRFTTQVKTNFMP